MKLRPSPWARAWEPRLARQQEAAAGRASARAPAPDSAHSPDFSPITIYAWTKKRFWRSVWITRCRFQCTDFLPYASVNHTEQRHGPAARAFAVFTRALPVQQSACQHFLLQVHRDPPFFSVRNGV